MRTKRYLWNWFLEFIVYGFMKIINNPVSGLVAVSSSCENGDCEIARLNIETWLMSEGIGSGWSLRDILNECQ